MKRIIKLTESDLTRIVKRVINETEFDFSQTDKKLFSDFLTIKNDFKYVTNNDGVEIYSLKRNGFYVVVATKESNEPSKMKLMIYVNFPMGKNINYLGEVKGMSSVEVGMNDYGKITNLLQGAIDFGKAQSDYDNLPPLPR
jgi:uncharacterized pyridoxamine 5'-phosphate oxidase family protein